MALAAQKNLKRVKFWSCDVEDPEVDAILDRLLPVKTLQEINLGDNPLTAEKKELIRSRARSENLDLHVGLF